jgi:mRNA-degrading endonuclease toxin of MazEF toxin-antitoxin module
MIKRGEIYKVPKDYPTNVRVPSVETGLSKDTVFLCFQMRSLDPKRFWGLVLIWPTLKREPQNIEQGISNVEV